MISYDRRGFGWSDSPPAATTRKQPDLNGLLSTLELTDVTLVGFSMGGGEIARYASTFGTGRLRSVVFASAVPPHLHKSNDNPGGGLDDIITASCKDGVPSARSAFLCRFVEHFTSAGERHDLVSDENGPHGEAGRGVLARGHAGLHRGFQPHRLPRRPRCCGTAHAGRARRQRIVPFEISGARTAETSPGAELHVIEGGPHGINASRSEEFNRVLLAFLAR